MKTDVHEEDPTEPRREKGLILVYIMMLCDPLCRTQSLFEALMGII